MKKILIFLFFATAVGAFGVELTPTVAQGPYPKNGVMPGSLNFSMTAVGATMSATFTCTGKELLVAYNPGVSDATFCIHSVTDEFGATGDVAETISGASVCAFWFGAKHGWDSGSGVSITTATPGLKLGVIHVPQVFKPVSAATTASRFTVSNVLGPYPTDEQILASHLELQQTPAFSHINNATIPINGREILLIHNSDVDRGFYNTGLFRISSGGVYDSFNRMIRIPHKGNPSIEEGHYYDITNDEWYCKINLAEWACWVFSQTDGWVNSDGHCWMTFTADEGMMYIGIAKLGK